MKFLYDLEECGELHMKFNNYEFDNKVNGEKLTIWILFGSLTETVLQMYIIVYMDEYKAAKCELWENFDKSYVNERISDTVKRMIDLDKITNEQGKSIKSDKGLYKKTY